MQSATCTYPCYACEGKRDHRTGAWEGLPAPLRTYDRNMSHHQSWLANGGGVLGGEAGLALAKNHCSVVEEPILGKSEPEKPLLLILVPPGLHLKLGIVNDALVLIGKLWGDDNLEEWLRRRGIRYVPYHGVMLEGNECNRVLQHLDSLEQELPPHLAAIPSYLRSFAAVMASTFGLEPGPSWQEDIARMRTEFSTVHQLFDLRETPKVHIVLHHIHDFIR